MRGKIIKGISNFYYVSTAQGTFECKAKGVFRKDHQKPLVGDDVEMDPLDAEKKLGNIVTILERKSMLIRPNVANVDQALIIFAITKPKPNLQLLDRFLIMMETRDLPCVICFNKMDLDEDGCGEAYRDIYEKCGYRTVLVSTFAQTGLDAVREVLKKKTTTVAGPSGVGKSSLINCLLQKDIMETGAISEKIERGKNTTRHIQLEKLDEDTYILDTPGFSSLDLFDVEKEELASYYPEFRRYMEGCRFQSNCAHVSEPVCGVRRAVEEGKIARLRYENYCLMYEELKKKKKY